MTTEQQIQERAKADAHAFCFKHAISEVQADLEELLRASLTAQQTATESAHREEVDRLTKERNGWAHSSETWEQLHAKDHEELTAARAEADQLREVLGRVTEALTQLVKLADVWTPEFTREIHNARVSAALAAPLLKEGE